MSDPRLDNRDIELAALRKEHRRTWAKAVKTYRGLKRSPDELAVGGVG